MKTREFNIENYSTRDILLKAIENELEAHLDTFVTEFGKVKKSTYKYRQSITNYVEIEVNYEKLPKATKKLVIIEARKQYEIKKAKSIKDYKEMRKKCDDIFHDDNQYKKLTPELDNLYYCQALTALKDFYDKKMKSKAVSNSRFQARAMSYSKIACD